tara:strand:+ start:295 stop:642 length:348 start_codon:yes stop_codon:yes gene_type:complete
LLVLNIKKIDNAENIKNQYSKGSKSNRKNINDKKLKYPKEIKGIKKISDLALTFFIFKIIPPGNMKNIDKIIPLIINIHIFNEVIRICINSVVFKVKFRKLYDSIRLVVMSMRAN